MSKKSTPPPPALVEAAPVVIALRDGTRGTATLRPLTIRQLYRFIEHLGGRDMPALVCLCVDQPPDWIDLLSDESYRQLVQLCLDANFTRAAKLAQSDPFTAAKLAPLLASLNQATTLLAAGTTSSAPSPAPAASVSAAAIGSDSST